MTEIVDLWPDKIAVEKLITPVTILRQQASLLGKKTKNIVQGEVEDLRAFNLNDFKYAFYFVAPALENYRYKLLDIFYELSLYPVKIDVEEEVYEEMPDKYINIFKHESIIANSEEEFMEILKVIFNSEKVLRVISVLLSQSDPSYDPSLKEKTQQ